jgi:hypothetical protein
MSEYRGAHNRQQEELKNKLKDNMQGIQPLHQNNQEQEQGQRRVPDSRNYDRNGNFAPKPDSARDYREMGNEKIHLQETERDGIYYGYDDNNRQVWSPDAAGRPQAGEWRVEEDGRIQMKDGGERTHIRERAPGGDRSRVNVGNHKWKDVESPDRYVVADRNELGKLKRDVERDEGPEKGYDRDRGPRKDDPTRGQGREEEQPERHHKEHSKDKGYRGR